MRIKLATAFERRESQATSMLHLEGCHTGSSDWSTLLLAWRWAELLLTSTGTVLFVAKYRCHAQQEPECGSTCSLSENFMCCVCSLPDRQRCGLQFQKAHSVLLERISTFYPRSLPSIGARLQQPLRGLQHC
mmetsp:Transcript_45379/g.107856  ORF Transcript_45379/g.107856 Transcript_45379/m.107856 type:complete len:132 (+) Transcript_45379:147-542(+)